MRKLELNQVPRAASSHPGRAPVLQVIELASNFPIRTEICILHGMHPGHLKFVKDGQCNAKTFI